MMKVLNFVNAKRNREVVEIQVGKSLNPVDLAGLEIESLEVASFKDLKVAYQKLCLKIVFKKVICIFP